MYKVTFFDKVENQRKVVKVHTFRAADDMLKALYRNAARYNGVQFTQCARTRFREIVITVAE